MVQYNTGSNLAMFQQLLRGSLNPLNSVISLLGIYSGEKTLKYKEDIFTRMLNALLYIEKESTSTSLYCSAIFTDIPLLFHCLHQHDFTALRNSWKIKV